MKLSICIPVYNEQDNIKVLYQRLSQVLPQCCDDYEMIFVDDGSSDQSMAVLAALNAKDSKVTAISFSRNFGQQLAIMAAYEAAGGDVLISMDADLQDPPEFIPKMIDKWKEGFEVVYAVREARLGESLFKLWSAALFYRLLRKLTGIAIPVDAGDFRLVDRKVVSVVNSMREQHRFVRGMTAWTGFRQTGLPYVREARVSGYTKYSLAKMLLLAVDGLTSFSHSPLQLATTSGVIISGASLASLVFCLIMKLNGHGYHSIGTLCILFVGGLQLFCLGIIGEYLGRIYDETKHRPPYVIKAKIGLSPAGNASQSRQEPLR